MHNHGIININKESGPTSHSVVARVRRILGQNGQKRPKAGHTGTLDPFAEGVLPVCVGRATKLAGYLTAQDKSYKAELHLGFATDTDDITGEIIAGQRGEASANFARSASLPSIDEIRSAVESFRGEILQVPPMYSAIKKDGKRLYELARAGETIEREPRRVTVSGIKITGGAADNSRVWLEIDCSKGTYIRSLCRDIGEKLGCGGTMGKLVRTRSGIFSIDSAVSLAGIAPEELAAKIIPVEEAYPVPKFMLTNGDFVKSAINGRAVPRKLVTECYRLACRDTVCRVREQGHLSGDTACRDKAWLYTPQNELIGLYKTGNEKLSLEVMFYENS